MTDEQFQELQAELRAIKGALDALVCARTKTVMLSWKFFLPFTYPAIIHNPNEETLYLEVTGVDGETGWITLWPGDRLPLLCTAAKLRVPPGVDTTKSYAKKITMMAAADD